MLLNGAPAEYVVLHDVHNNPARTTARTAHVTRTRGCKHGISTPAMQAKRLP